jgi:hypothetical protein
MQKRKRLSRIDNLLQKHVQNYFKHTILFSEKTCNFPFLANIFVEMDRKIMKTSAKYWIFSQYVAETARSFRETRHSQNFFVLR